MTREISSGGGVSGVSDDRIKQHYFVNIKNIARARQLKLCMPQILVTPTYSVSFLKNNKKGKRHIVSVADDVG